MSTEPETTDARTVGMAGAASAGMSGAETAAVGRSQTLARNVQGWPLRRWAVAVAAAAVTYVVVAIPTDLIDTPFFVRQVAVTWWAQPVLIVTAVLAGLLTATYVALPGHARRRAGTARLGGAGAIVSLFAVGCPVCNKLVLLALGASGAMQFFEPVQPYLGAASIALLAWALFRRLTSEDSCPVRLNS